MPDLAIASFRSGSYVDPRGKNDEVVVDVAPASTLYHDGCPDAFRPFAGTIVDFTFEDDSACTRVGNWYLHGLLGNLPGERPSGKRPARDC